MGTIVNQKTTFIATPTGVDTGSQAMPAGTNGVLVCMAMPVAGIATYYDGTDATGTVLGSIEFPNVTTEFPAGFMPEFTNGVWRVVTGSVATRAKAWFA